jgi:N-acetyl-anhydromuramyl-L-alanine amidase AmpD
MRKIDIICIHCTATLPSATAQSILDGWRKKGWTSNGYHWLIDRFGIATRLQDDELVSNGVKGHNSRSIHICYIGGMLKGKPTDTRTAEQKETLKMLVEQYLVKWPKAEVLGHRDLSPDLDKDGIVEPHEFVKSCPCYDVKKEYAKA